MFVSHCHRCGLESAQTAPGITGQVSYQVQGFSVETRSWSWSRSLRCGQHSRCGGGRTSFDALCGELHAAVGFAPMPHRFYVHDVLVDLERHSARRSRCTRDRSPGQVRSKSNGSSVAAARDDMDESDLMMVGFIENPIVFEGEADEVSRIIMVCFANTGEVRDQSADRHEIVMIMPLPSCSSRRACSMCARPSMLAA